jgi:hypothetical protein
MRWVSIRFISLDTRLVIVWHARSLRMHRNESRPLRYWLRAVWWSLLRMSGTGWRDVSTRRYHQTCT